MPYVRFPDAIALTVEALRDALPTRGYPDVPVDFTYGGEPVAVRVSTDGGPVIDSGQLAEPRVRVNCWHSGGQRAAVDLAATVGAIVRALPDDPMTPVGHVRQPMLPTPVESEQDRYPRAYVAFVLTTSAEQEQTA